MSEKPTFNKNFIKTAKTSQAASEKGNQELKALAKVKVSGGTELGKLLNGGAKLENVVNKQTSMQDLNAMADALDIQGCDVFTSSKKAAEANAATNFGKAETSERKKEEKAKEKLVDKVKTAISHLLMASNRSEIKIAEDENSPETADSENASQEEGKEETTSANIQFGSRTQVAEVGKMNSLVKTPEEWAKLTGTSTEEQKGVITRYTSYQEASKTKFSKENMAEWTTDDINKALASEEMEWEYADLKLLLTENKNFTDAQFSELLNRIKLTQEQYDELMAMDLTESQRKILEKYHVYPEDFPSDDEGLDDGGGGCPDLSGLADALGSLLGDQGGGGCDGGGGGGGGDLGGDLGGDEDGGSRFEAGDLDNISEKIKDMIDSGEYSPSDVKKLTGYYNNAQQAEKDMDTYGDERVAKEKEAGEQKEAAGKFEDKLNDEIDKAAKADTAVQNAKKELSDQNEAVDKAYEKFTNSNKAFRDATDKSDAALADWQQAKADADQAEGDDKGRLQAKANFYEEEYNKAEAEKKAAEAAMKAAELEHKAAVEERAKKQSALNDALKKYEETNNDLKEARKNYEDALNKKEAAQTAAMVAAGKENAAANDLIKARDGARSIEYEMLKKQNSQ